MTSLPTAVAGRAREVVAKALPGVSTARRSLPIRAGADAASYDLVVNCTGPAPVSSPGWKRTETELIEAINLAMKDPSWFSASVAKRLRSVRGDAPTAEVNAKLSRLTAREQQVLELLCEGLSGPELAKAVGVSKNTVRNHVSGLYKELGVHSRAELIVWARRHGVVV